MKSQNLLSQLSNLDATLGNFSLEELSVDEAIGLKKLFDSFRSQLESKIWGEQHSSIDDYKKKNDGDSQKEAKLIANVSHEIRTPLNGIIGFTELLKEGKLTTEQQEHVDSIQWASRTLMSISNELLEYSGLSVGLEEFDFVSFNFQNLIQEVVYLCKTLILESDVKLEVELDSELPEVLIGDPSKLSQVLLNLLGNAIKFIEKGTVLLKIDLIKEDKDNLIIGFEVTDTGIGISEEDLKHIFESFKQAKQGTFSKYGGYGLGLSIVKKIVERLEGNIEVNSRIGVGTTFRLQLPYTRSEGIQNNEKQNAEQRTDQVRGMQILVFEDNILNQRLIEVRLKAWGCKTFITENAAHGLSILEAHKVDMVLMDLRMPVMNGYEVTQLIRKNPKKTIESVPIIALTADFTVDDKEACKSNGIDDYILKPYGSDELLSKLIKYKNNRHAMNKIESAFVRQDAYEVNVDAKIDIEPVMKECLGQLDLLEELVRLYKQNALEFIGKVKIHLQNDDFKGIAFASHKLKGGLKMMRSYGLHSIVEQMHSNTQTEKDTKHLSFLHNCFVEEYPKVEELIDKELKKLREG